MRFKPACIALFLVVFLATLSHAIVLDGWEFEMSRVKKEDALNVGSGKLEFNSNYRWLRYYTDQGIAYNMTGDGTIELYLSGEADWEGDIDVGGWMEFYYVRHTSTTDGWTYSGRQYECEIGGSYKPETNFFDGRSICNMCYFPALAPSGKLNCDHPETTYFNVVSEEGEFMASSNLKGMVGDSGELESRSGNTDGRLFLFDISLEVATAELGSDCSNDLDDDYDGAIDCDDSDCAEELVCTAECFSGDDCGEGKECRESKCVMIAGTCRGNEDCEEGFECRQERCVEDVDCTKDDDCFPGLVCKDKKCVKKEAECAQDIDCSPGLECKNGNCVEGVDVPGRDELQDEMFDEEDLLPEMPDVPELDEETKRKIKKWTGLDVDDYSKNMGKGKKGYVIINETLNPNRLEMVYTYKKVQYMVAFMKNAGYDVRLVYRKSSDEVFEAIANPNAGAVAYFGHAASTSLEDMDIEGGVDARLAIARSDWYEKQGMDPVEARKKANGEDSMNLDFYYNHTCHSADAGFEDFADVLVRKGGVYYGEEGLLWATSPPSTEYIRS